MSGVYKSGLQCDYMSLVSCASFRSKTVTLIDLRNVLLNLAAWPLCLRSFLVAWRTIVEPTLCV
eukprot:1456602-Amphidinium_carterae.1